MTSGETTQGQARMDRAAEDLIGFQDENFALGGVCDFCGKPIPQCESVTTFMCDGPVVVEIAALAPDGSIGRMTHVLSPDWAACEKCRPVVEQNDPVALEANAIANRDERMPTPDPGSLRDLYQKFYSGNPRVTHVLQDEVLVKHDATDGQRVNTLLSYAERLLPVVPDHERTPAHHQLAMIIDATGGDEDEWADDADVIVDDLFQVIHRALPGGWEIADVAPGDVCIMNVARERHGDDH